MSSSHGGGSSGKLFVVTLVTLIIVAAFIFLLPILAKLNILGPVRKGASYVYIAPKTKIWLLIGVRYALSAMMAIAGLVATISGYNWLHDEGNDNKKYENKNRLGNAMIMISILFVLMAIFHYFVPDYSRLAL